MVEDLTGAVGLEREGDNMKMNWTRTRTVNEILRLGCRRARRVPADIDNAVDAGRNLGRDVVVTQARQILTSLYRAWLGQDGEGRHELEPHTLTTLEMGAHVFEHCDIQ